MCELVTAVDKVSYVRSEALGSVITVDRAQSTATRKRKPSPLRSLLQCWHQHEYHATPMHRSAFHE